MARIVARLHERSGGRSVLAACDKKLLGKKFSGGGLVLDLKTHKEFYGDECSDKELKEMMLGAHDLNLVGEQAISLAASAVGVSKSGVKKIAGVPHLQVYRI